MTECTKTLTPADDLQDAIDALPTGGTICLKKGVYAAQLWIEKTMTLRALEAGVVLDARSKNTAVMIPRPGHEILIEGIRIINGDSGGSGDGGNVSLIARSSVTVRNCILERGSSDSNGGGGVMASDGTLVLDHCELRKNSGSHASAVLLTGIAKASIIDSIVVTDSHKSPTIAAYGGTSLTISHSVIWHTTNTPLELARVANYSPTVEIARSIIAQNPVQVGPTTKPTIRVQASALSAPIPNARAEDAYYGPITLDASFHPAPDAPYSSFGPRK